jgi:archaellum component FlaG (FlaF/FlaG flagellin family)
MPSMTKTKDGYSVYNKNTGKTKLYKSKKKAQAIVKKGYKSKENIIENGGSDYGGQLFKAENWLS